MTREQTRRAGRPQRRTRRPPFAPTGEAPPATVPLPSELLELTVGPVAHGGMCVARTHSLPPVPAGTPGAPPGPGGLVVFVRHALPGEQVLARVTGTGRRFWRADAVEILVPSPDRVPEPCPHAHPGGCGGCDWQHVALARQRRLKADVVREQLSRLAGLDIPVVVEEVPGTPDGLGWRTRVRFAVDADGRVGLHRHRSDEVEPLTGCPIAAPQVGASGVFERRWRPGSEVEVEVETSAGGPGGASAVRLTGEHPEGGAPALTGPAVLRHHVAGRDYRVSPGSFWQVHPAAATTLSDTVLAMLAPAAGERALDLYAGAGLFAARLAEAVGAQGSVLAVEGAPAAAADAVHNLADLPQAMVRQAAVSAATLRGGGDPDVVVLDPPRSGAGRAVVAALTALRPRAIAYVACDPAALGRDVALAAEAGYRLTALRAFDLFPMTSHVECVALLEA